MYKFGNRLIKNRLENTGVWNMLLTGQTIFLFFDGLGFAFEVPRAHNFLSVASDTIPIILTNTICGTLVYTIACHRFDEKSIESISRLRNLVVGRK